MIQLNQNIQDLQKFNISTKDLLSLLSELKVGQVLRGKVAETMGKNEILLILNGQKMLARTSLNLMVGDILLLKVQSIKPSIVLQFFGIESASTQDPGSEVLRMFNLNKDEVNKLLISNLLRYNLPITKSEIHNFLNVFNTILLKIARVEKNLDNDGDIKLLIDNLKLMKIPIQEENLINVLAFLKANNIPITPSIALKAMSFLFQKQNIMEDLSQLKLLLNSNKAIPGDLTRRLNLFLEPNIDLETAVGNLGLDYEKKVATLLKGKEVKDLHISNTIKGTMLELLQIIHDNPKMENADKLQMIASRILNNIEVQQLLNREETGLNKNWIIQVPILIENDFKTLEIKISKRKNANKIYTNQTASFSLKLEMTNLGIINSSGNLFNNNLSCFFGLKNADMCDLFEGGFEELKSKIQEHGFKVVNLQTEIVPEVNSENADNYNRYPSISAIDYKA